jgi:hypothetical protein
MSQLFEVEQVALAVENITAAVSRYQAAGFEEWFKDTVTLQVNNYNEHGQRDSTMAVAELAFNYQVIPGKEFELIEFKVGENFHENLSVPGLSHMGLHVDNIHSWMARYRNMYFKTLMEARTISHTGKPAETGVRYKYVILNTIKEYGFYLKLIERIEPVMD